MPAHNEITDHTVYNTRMARSMWDKLFFVDKIEADVILDYGCADGCMIEHLLPWFPNAAFIGYDIDPEMVETANKRFVNEVRVPTITDNWGQIVDAVHAHQRLGMKVALMLESLIHEVYTYSDTRQIDKFWDTVWNTGFDYIITRDMMPNRSIDRPSSQDDVARVYRRFLHTKELRDFETTWGSIENNKNLLHFLLKYQYDEPNWPREVKENYIPIYREDLLAMIPVNYDFVYQEHFALPWFKRQVKKDFGIVWKDPTHLKLVLEKV